MSYQPAPGTTDVNPAVPLAGEFTTLTPREQARGVLDIAPGRTLGVAAPVEIQFSGPVPDRGAVEGRLRSPRRCRSR